MNIVAVVSLVLGAVVHVAAALASVASSTYSAIDQQITPNVRAMFPLIGRSQISVLSLAYL